jgi:hypothetical protein
VGPVIRDYDRGRKTVSENSDTGDRAEPEQPQDRRPERDEMDEFLKLLLEIEDPTPEEAGYGHGV